MGLGHEKSDIYRLLVILSRRGGKGYRLADSSTTYRTEPVAVDFDSDFDFDTEDEKT
jgi:hypothetical protein